MTKCLEHWPGNHKVPGVKFGTCHQVRLQI